MSSDERKKMIDKIVALIAKAESSEHDAESELFKNKAAELMAQYSIDFTDIGTNDEPRYETHNYITINPTKYELTLETAIGKFNGILVIQITRTNGAKYIRLVGRREDIDAHTYMMDLVKGQMTYQFNSFKASKYIMDEPVTTKEKSMWHMGFAYGVNNRVWDLINAGKDKKQEWGLVVVDPVKAAQDWYAYQHALTIRKSRSAQFSAAGLASGRNVNLNRGLNFGNGSAIMIGA